MHYVADLDTPHGYSKRTGPLDPLLRPFGITATDGRVVYLSTLHSGTKLHKKLAPYTAAVNLERRALAETALATIILHNPHLVGAVLHKVSAGITQYWQARRQQLGKAPAPASPPQRGGYYSGRPLATAPAPATNPIAWQAIRTTSSYTHGATSYGRLGTAFPTQLEQGVRQDLSALYGNSIPQTINVHDNFLRIFSMLGPSDMAPGGESGRWLTSHRGDPAAKELTGYWNANSADWRRLKVLENQLRPAFLFDLANPEARGRAKVGAPSAPDANANPGLLPNAMPAHLDAGWRRLRAEWFGGRTLPVEKEARKRGMELFSPAETSEFIREVRKHNLIFAAGQSGTTSTLFQSALFFGKLTGDDRKTYLMAAVGYLVGGGMHSCHEMFKTASLAGIDVPYKVGGYDQAIPAHIKDHALYKQWAEEFGDVAGHNKYLVP